MAAGAGGDGARVTTGAGAGAGRAGAAGATARARGCVVAVAAAAAGAGAVARAGLGGAPTVGATAGTGAIDVTGPPEAPTVTGRSGIASTMVSVTGAGGGTTTALVGGGAPVVATIMAGACAISCAVGAEGTVVIVGESFVVFAVAAVPLAATAAVVVEPSDVRLRGVVGRFAAASDAVNPNMPDTAMPATAIRAPPATCRLRAGRGAVRRVGAGRTGPSDEDGGGAAHTAR